MINRPLRGVAGAVSGSLAAAAAGQLTLVVSGVLLARGLGAQNRGYLALLFLLPVIVIQIGEVGLPGATSYFLAAELGDARSIIKLLLRPCAIQLGAMAAAQALALSLYLADKPNSVRTAAIFTFLQIPAALATDYGLAILQGRRRFAIFNGLRIMPAAFNAVAILLVFATGTRELPPYSAASYVALTVSGAVIVTAALRDVLAEPSGSQRIPRLAPMLRFGLKAMIGSLYPVESFRLDQLFVGLVFSPLALGYYVVAVAFTSLPRFVAQSVGLVAYPYVASQSDRAARRRWLWIFASSTSVLLVLCVAVLEVVLSPLVRWFFGPSFLPSVPIARVLLIAGLIQGGRRILAEGLKGAGYPFAGTASEFASWIALAPCLAAVATYRVGPVGAALSVVISSGVSLATVLVIDRRHAARKSRPDGPGVAYSPENEEPDDSAPVRPN